MRGGVVAQVGDKTEIWRRSYSRVRKDLLSDPQSTNRSRLSILGVDAMPRSAPLLDLGSGDGNLFTTLLDLGFERLWGLEYQQELLVEHPRRDRVIIASATHIPYRTCSMSGVVVMDVFHHLSPNELPPAIGEIHRILEPGGMLFICEPADTLTRKVLTLLLMSPLSRLSRFAMDKRTMVEQERETLDPWLESESRVADRLMAAGFRLEFFRRCWLHSYGRFRAVPLPRSRDTEKKENAHP
jgi:SAM-dependent methyltransferase